MRPTWSLLKKSNHSANFTVKKKRKKKEDPCPPHERHNSKTNGNKSPVIKGDIIWRLLFQFEGSHGLGSSGIFIVFFHCYVSNLEGGGGVLTSFIQEGKELERKVATKCRRKKGRKDCGERGLICMLLEYLAFLCCRSSDVLFKFTVSVQSPFMYLESQGARSPSPKLSKAKITS
jgi:hypothetical protein